MARDLRGSPQRGSNGVANREIKVVARSSCRIPIRVALVLTRPAPSLDESSRLGTHRLCARSRFEPFEQRWQWQSKNSADDIGAVRYARTMLRGWWGAASFFVVACGGKSAHLGAAGATAADEPRESGGASGFTAASGAGSKALAGASNSAANGGSASGSAGSNAARGGAANAGAANAGGAALEACTPGAVRCKAVRERCDESGSWVRESFVCAVDITAAQEEQAACAVKSDGKMACFGDFVNLMPALVGNAPPRSWVKLILADDPIDPLDHQLCGIDQAGESACWGSKPPLRTFGPTRYIAHGSGGLCVVMPGGEPFCYSDFGSGVMEPKLPSQGPFQALLMQNDLLFGLRVDGTVDVAEPSYSLPAGVYTQISAGSYALCGLRQDRTLACAPRAAPPALASQHFIELAVNYWGCLCAIREDQSVVCDGLGSGYDSTYGTPPSDKFTRLVASQFFMCGIRVDGSLECFGEAPPRPPADW